MESALATIVRDFCESGLNDEFPALVQALFKRVGLAGFGAERLIVSSRTGLKRKSAANLLNQSKIHRSR